MVYIEIIFEKITRNDEKLGKKEERKRKNEEGKSDLFTYRSFYRTTLPLFARF